VIPSDGVTTLTNTIVAGNNGGDVFGGSPDGANNLIGGNPLLAALGDYGGPTQTMPLLPGSPAIGRGTTTGAPATDQRGQPRAGRVDIGAFQSQGFTLSPVAGSSPQSAVVGKTFRNPLQVTVTGINPVEPVDGGVISFAVTPVNGASATLSAATAVIAVGQASVKATANATPGTYNVTGTVAGAATLDFVLTNTKALGLGPPPSHEGVQEFDNLASLREAIAYANSHPGPDTIVFDPASFGTRRRTIRLTGGPLVLTNSATTTIIGPGPNVLTLSGGGKSRVIDIEGGSLALERVTISGGNAGTGNGGGIRNDGGKLWLNDVVLRGNRAREGGGLFNNGSATLTDVVSRGNTARAGPGLFSTRRATLAWRSLSTPASKGPILFDLFNGTGGVRKKREQFAGPAGAVVEKRHNLTITDSAGSSTGILSTASTVPFNPQGVVTTEQAQINGIDPNGKAMVGLIGPNGSASPTGSLAAGIDAKGHVFNFEHDPRIPQTVVPIGVDTGYSGGRVRLTFTINSTGVKVSAGSFNSGEIPFSDLHNFSLKAAFKNGAIPALGVASQPNETGGAASFRSIRVRTERTS
jgi:hypothetical protein